MMMHMMKTLFVHDVNAVKCIGKTAITVVAKEVEAMMMIYSLKILYGTSQVIGRNVMYVREKVDGTYALETVTKMENMNKIEKRHDYSIIHSLTLMPALSYKSNFVDYVEEGLRTMGKAPRRGRRIKRQTIRNFRRYPLKPGDKLYHYYAQRSVNSRKLGESVCRSCRNIIINHHAVLIAKAEGGYPEWKGSYTEITDEKQLDDFAYADGFANWREMKLWWKLTHGMNCFPFVGQLIQW
jgi:hypothetical protein